MKIAVLSGKGGTGKTFVSVNLASTVKDSVYIDCDVEEPNGELFFKPQVNETHKARAIIPSFSKERCIGCKKCVEFCKFNALIYIKDKPRVFNEVCHGCGGCKLVCPQNAVEEITRDIGEVKIGKSLDTTVISGSLNLGEASGIGVIKKALSLGERENKEITVIDCPPGSACSVTESIENADYCIIVAEGTAFGFHNFKMVVELAGVLKKPCGVIINKYNEAYEPLESFCSKNNLPVLARIPYNEHLARLTSQGEIAVKNSDELKASFEEILNKIGGALK